MKHYRGQSIIEAENLELNRNKAGQNRELQAGIVSRMINTIQLTKPTDTRAGR